jgi:outer membrane protein assembly factor BamB
MMRFFTSLLLTILFFGNLSSQDLVEWRGPNRSGIYPDKGLLTVWPEKGPEIILEIDGMGEGYSSPVVYHDIIYVTGTHDSVNFISAIDLKGKLVWRKDYSPAWFRTYPGSRCTPTIENNRIYLVGGTGDIVCMNAINGEIIWSKNPHVEFNGKYMWFGVSESTLLNDNAALYVTGGNETTMVALDKRNGELIWKSKSVGGEKTYASASLIERNGLQIALVQTSKDLVGIDVNNGQILWTYNLSQYHGDHKGKGESANIPLYRNGQIFVTYGNEQKGSMFNLSNDGRSIQLKWQSDILDTHIGGLVLIDGNIYASTMTDNANGNWASVNWETGKTNWETKWFTKGSIISADGMLYCYEDKSGNIGLVKPNPEKFDLVSSFKIHKGSGPHWAHPSIYNGKLFVRHGESLMVYNLKK